MNRLLVVRTNTNVILYCLLASLCFGLFLSKTFTLINWYVAAFFVFIILIANKKRGLWIYLAIVVFGFSLGMYRGSVFKNNINIYENYYDRTITIYGVASDDPGYTDKKLTEFHINKANIDKHKLPGRVRVRSLSASNIGRGDEVIVVGKLRRTIGTGRQGSVSYANISVIKHNQSWVEKLRSKFFASVYSSLPEPQASLGIGYLVGVRTALPADFSLALSAVGLTHIVAVSGYNLTIIVQFIKKLFSKISAYQTVLFSGVLIVGFLLMTGWSPSIMRAAIISGFSLLAWYYGRSFKPIVLILLGASITSFINPLYIWGDVGWYLSFMAFTGVLLLAPIIMYFLGEKSKNIFVVVLVETLSAQLLTLPYISVIFGRISIISPVANLIVIPFIPLSMLLIFITGVIGMVLPGLALWVAVPAKILMTFTVWVIENLSHISWAQSSFRFTIIQAAIMYLVIFSGIIFGWYLYQKRLGRGEDKIDWNLL